MIDRHPVRFFVHKRPHVDYFLDVVSISGVCSFLIWADFLLTGLFLDFVGGRISVIKSCIISTEFIELLLYLGSLLFLIFHDLSCCVPL